MKHLRNSLFAMLFMAFCGMPSAWAAAPVDLNLSGEDAVWPTDSVVTPDTVVVVAADSLGIIAADSLGIVAADSLTVIPADSLVRVIADSIAKILADSLAPIITDSLSNAITDSLTTAIADSLALVIADSIALANEQAELRAAINRVLTADSIVNAKYNAVIDVLIRRNRAQMKDEPADNPLFVRLSPPLTLYRSPVARALKPTDLLADEPPAEEGSAMQSWDKDLALMDALDRMLFATYMRKPTLVRRTEDQLMGTKPIDNELISKSVEGTAMNVAVGGTVERDRTISNSGDVLVKKPNFWTTKGSMSNQWSESYISDNWYQGGVSNLNILSFIILDANYNNKRKVTWNNRLEAKVGFYMNNYTKSPDEGRSEIRANTDLLRITSSLNLKAIRKWNYTAQLQGYTQMMNQWKGSGEEQVLKSCFLSPTYASFSLGMNYSTAFKNNKGNVSIFLGPITYNARYVRNDYVMNNSGYIPKEQRKGDTEPVFHHYYDDFGSKVEVNMNYTFSKNISYSGRLFYYTTLKYVQTEWESTFTMRANKYLSTKLILHPRFDDSRAKDDKWGYLMFKEFLSIGFDYTW